MEKNNLNLEYHRYLKSHSLVGKIYKKYFLHKFLLKHSGYDFLDVGCGLGSFLSLGSEKALGLDINEYNVKYVNKKGLKAKLIPNDGIFPLSDKSYKSIVCDQVLEHIPDSTLFLKEINRVIKSPGQLMLGLPLEMGYKADKDHCSFYTPKKAIQLIERNTRLVHQRTIYYPLPLKIFGKFFKQQFFYLLFRT